MQLLASCSIEQSKTFNGKLVIPNEDQKKPDKVFLNIVVEDGSTEVFSVLSGNEKCVTFKGKQPDFCPKELSGKVFYETSLEDFQQGYERVEDITTLVRLPEGYSNMKQLVDWCKEYESIRFIGGNLLAVEGVRIGRFDEGKDKMLPVFNGIYDSFVEVDLNDLDGLQEIVKKTRKRAEGQDGETKKSKSKSGRVTSKEKAPAKKPKRLEAFQSLFSSEGEDDF